MEDGGSLELDTATFNSAVTFLGLGEVEELADADIYEGDREGTYVVDTTPGEEDGSFIVSESTDGTGEGGDIINVYKSTNDADGEKYVVDYSYGEDGGAFIINTGEGEYAAVYNGEFEGEYVLDLTPMEDGGSLELDTATFNSAVTFLGLGEVEELADADVYEGDREGTFVVDTTPGEEDGSFIVSESTDGTADIINVYKSTNDADG